MTRDSPPERRFGRTAIAAAARLLAGCGLALVAAACANDRISDAPEESLPAGVPEPAAITSYFPPPETARGWRKRTGAAFVRRQGLDPDSLIALQKYVLSLPRTGATGFLVIKNGWVVREAYAPSGAVTRLFNLRSNAKAMTILLFGRLVAEGAPRFESEEAPLDETLPLLGLDSPLYHWVWLPEGFPLSDPRKALVTFRNVFEHVSGIIPESTGDREAKNDVTGLSNWEFLPYTVGHDEDYPRSAPLYFTPGTRQGPWSYLTRGYSSVAFNHLTFVFERLTGMPAKQWLRRGLLDPIGVGPARVREIQGYWPAASGVSLTARDYARIAYLMLRQGNWAGKRIFEPSYLEAFTRTPHSWTIRSNVDGHFGSRYPPDLYRIAASRLNWAFVVPSLDLIAIRVGNTDNARFEEVQARFLEKLFASVIRR